MRMFGYVCASAALALAGASAGYAQSQTPPGQTKKITAPHQTTDRGNSDAQRPLTATEAAAVVQRFGKNENGVVFKRLPNGATAAILDDSYAEAMTVTRRADGTLAFGHTMGLENAARSVEAGASSTATARKAATKKPAAAPALEEK